MGGCHVCGEVIPDTQRFWVEEISAPGCKGCAIKGLSPYADGAFDFLDAYDLEFRVSKTILKYYGCLAREDDPPTLTPQEVREVALYFCGTVTSELRHRSRAKYIYEPGLWAWELLDSWGVSAYSGDRSARIDEFLRRATDFDLPFLSEYLKGAAYVFAGNWGGGAYGGPAWAHCAWHAHLWVRAMLNNNGNVPVLMWENWINSAHNNGRWVSKLGCVLYRILDLGNMAAKSVMLKLEENAKKAETFKELEKVVYAVQMDGRPSVSRAGEVDLPNMNKKIPVRELRKQKETLQSAPTPDPNDDWRWDDVRETHE